MYTDTQATGMCLCVYRQATLWDDKFAPGDPNEICKIDMQEPIPTVVEMMTEDRSWNSFAQKIARRSQKVLLFSINLTNIDLVMQDEIEKVLIDKLRD